MANASVIGQLHNMLTNHPERMHSMLEISVFNNNKVIEKDEIEIFTNHPENKIREKVEFDTANPQYIETIWGVGYRFKV